MAVMFKTPSEYLTSAIGDLGKWRNNLAEFIASRAYSFDLEPYRAIPEANPSDPIFVSNFVQREIVRRVFQRQRLRRQIFLDFGPEGLDRVDTSEMLVYMLDDQSTTGILVMIEERTVVDKPFRIDGSNGTRLLYEAIGLPSDADKNDLLLSRLLRDLPLEVAGSIPIPILFTKAPRLRAAASAGDALLGSAGPVTIGPKASVNDMMGFITVAHGITAGKKYAYLNGSNCNEALIDFSWDAAFVPDPSLGYPSALRNRCLKPAGRVAPGRGLACEYFGAVSGLGGRQTVVQGEDKIFPKWNRREKARIYTEKCVCPGDSGALLISGDTALAIAGGSTDDGDDMQFSYWNWLPGILEVLDATLIPPTGSQPQTAASHARMEPQEG